MEYYGIYSARTGRLLSVSKVDLTSNLDPLQFDVEVVGQRTAAYLEKDLERREIKRAIVRDVDNFIDFLTKLDRRLK